MPVVVTSAEAFPEHIANRIAEQVADEDEVWMRTLLPRLDEKWALEKFKFRYVTRTGHIVLRLKHIDELNKRRVLWGSGDFLIDVAIPLRMYFGNRVRDVSFVAHDWSERVNNPPRELVAELCERQEAEARAEFAAALSLRAA